MGGLGGRAQASVIPEAAGGGGFLSVTSPSGGIAPDAWARQWGLRGPVQHEHRAAVPGMARRMQPPPALACRTGRQDPGRRGTEGDGAEKSSALTTTIIDAGGGLLRSQTQEHERRRWEGSVLNNAGRLSWTLLGREGAG